MNVLICNAGSSSIKFSLMDAAREHVIAEAEVELGRDKHTAARDYREAVARLLSQLRIDPAAPERSRCQIGAVGHRVVHGGECYVSAVLITSEVQREIQGLADLAPLHNSASLQVIDAVQQIMPEMPQVAAFDTAFHATLSEAARTYPLPHQWTSDWGLRRYGFHGPSHSYCASRSAEMIPGRDLRLIIAHLGNGASISAVRNGTCVDTSMGFTPLDGLMMGTRSGSVD